MSKSSVEGLGYGGGPVADATIWLRASTEMTAVSALLVPVTTTASPLWMILVTSGI